MKRYSIFVLLLLSQFAYCQLTRLQFNHISQLDGLSQSEVNCILQDNKGYIWAGTLGGLNRYNGYSFEVYKNDNRNNSSIGNNNIRTIFQDSNGNLWIGTRGGGLNLYNYKTNNFTSFNPSDTIKKSIATNKIEGIIESKNGFLLIATDKGLFSISTKDPEYSTKPSYRNIFNIPVNQLVEIDNNIFWLGTSNGIYKIKIENNKTEILNILDIKNNAFLSNQINAIYPESNSIIWAATPGGLTKIIDNNGTFSVTNYQKKDGLDADFITDIFEDESNNFWIGTRGGGLSLLNRYTNKITNYETSIYFEKSLSSNSIFCIYEDQTGVLWIGTSGNGISNIDLRHNKFENYKIILKNKTELPSNFIRAIYKDNDGIIWLGTLSGGFFKYDRNKDTFTNIDFKNTKNEIVQSGYNVFDIQKFDDNNLIIASSQGLCIYNKTSEKFTYFRTEANNPESIASNSVFSVAKDDNGDFWVGTWDGLHKFSYKNNQGSFKRFVHQATDPLSISNNVIVYIYNDPINSDMWIGTSFGGLSRMVTDPISGKVVFYNYVSDLNNPNSLSDNKVNMVLRSKKGDLWAVTENGLNKLVTEKGQNSQSFIRYTEANGLSNNSIKSLLEDDNGNLWMGTNNKLSMFNPETNVFNNFSFEDGLQSNEFSEHTCFKGDNGEVFFGGVKGFNSFFPNKIKSNKYEPKIVFTNFYVSNKLVKMGDTINGRVLLDAPIDQTKEITLSYKENFISFEFAALHFSAPGKNKYAYMLEGLNNDWYYTDSKQRIASFMNLEGGTYTLRVKASNNDGIWNNNGISLKIKVVPPFWKTTWFRILSILLIVSLVVLWVTKRTRDLKDNQLKLEREVEHATMEVKKKNEKLKDAQKRISSIVDEVKENLSKTSVQLSEAAVSQAATIEEVSATIDQMAEDITVNAKNSNDIYNQSIDVAKNADNSFTIVSKAVNSMQKISSEIGFVSEIAKHLKLLSLNAAIESSRAGLEGRGFSVIANEFKTLSENTQELALTIKDISNTGFSLSTEANEKINDLLILINNIVSLIEKINEANQNQSSEVERINVAVQELAAYINKTANLAKMLDSAINNLTFDESD